MSPIDQPKVSALVRERLAGFSFDRPVRFLMLLGSDVAMVVNPRARSTGQAGVLAQQACSFAAQNSPDFLAHRHEGAALFGWCQAVDRKLRFKRGLVLLDFRLVI